MTLSDAELGQLLYCAGAELRARRNGKPPGEQAWLVKLVRRLEFEVAVSSSRQDDEVDKSCSNYDDSCIGSRTAATLLGWDVRQVQRRAVDLDGCKISGKLVFREGAVRDYAEALTHGRTVA